MGQFFKRLLGKKEWKKLKKGVVFMGGVFYYFGELMDMKLDDGAWDMAKAFAFVDGMGMIMTALMTAGLCIGIMVTKDQNTAEKLVGWIKSVWKAWFCLSCVNAVFMWFFTLI